MRSDTETQLQIRGKPRVRHASRLSRLIHWLRQIRDATRRPGQKDTAAISRWSLCTPSFRSRILP